MNYVSYLFILLLTIIFVSISVNAVLQISDDIKETLTCRKPITILETPKENKRPFVIAGLKSGDANGLGNHLAFFPGK